MIDTKKNKTVLKQIEIPRDMLPDLKAVAQEDGGLLPKGYIEQLVKAQVKKRCEELGIVKGKKKKAVA